MEKKLLGMEDSEREDIKNKRPFDKCGGELAYPWLNLKLVIKHVTQGLSLSVDGEPYDRR